MPGSLNVPYGDVIAADGRLKSEADLRAVFEKAGVDLSKPIINTCGSGVTAAILALAQSIAGHDDAAVYDGSWSEWGEPDEPQRRSRRAEPMARVRASPASASSARASPMPAATAS